MKYRTKATVGVILATAAGAASGYGVTNYENSTIKRHAAPAIQEKTPEYTSTYGDNSSPENPLIAAMYIGSLTLLISGAGAYAYNNNRPEQQNSVKSAQPAEQ